MLAAVLHYMRASGWETRSFTRDKVSGLPKGIYTRKGGYQVTYTKRDNSLGYKLKETIEEVLAFHARAEAGEIDHEIDDDCEREGTEHDATDAVEYSGIAD